MKTQKTCICKSTITKFENKSINSNGNNGKSSFWTIHVSI